MQLAIDASRGIHMFCYDNLNLSTSIFTEQRGASGPSKVTSGTFGIIYSVRNGVPEHMELAPLMERFRKTTGLKFNEDLRPTEDQYNSFQSQLKIVIVRALTTYAPGFNSYSNNPLLQHKPRRAIPAGYVTKQFPLRVTTIEEASIDGNLLYHDEVYLNLLKRDTDSLSKYAIPSSNDQLTNSRIRSCFLNRDQDTNAWNRREVFTLGIGLFHLCLNLVWVVLHTHRGTLAQTGSLTYFFKILDKTRLGGDHPDYHSLLAALQQILNGLLLNAWRQECGETNLEQFSKSEPSAEDLLAIADKILADYASPLRHKDREDGESTATTNPANPTCSDSDDSDTEEEHSHRPAFPPSPAASSTTPPRDTIYENTRLLTRDLLYISELVRAVSDGDIGRIEDFLPQLAMMFRGAGSNNYCTEILHFILNLKHVWTPEFA